jgi:hypothetical protein
VPAQIAKWRALSKYAKSAQEVTPANEARFEARWKLGRLVAEKAKAGRPKGDSSSLAGLILLPPSKPSASTEPCIRSPTRRVDAAFAQSTKQGILNTVEGRARAEIASAIVRHNFVLLCCDKPLELKTCGKSVGRFPMITTLR